MPATHGCPAYGHGVVATAEGRKAVRAAACAGQTRHSPPAAARLVTLLHARAQVLRCLLGPLHRPGPSQSGEFLEGRLWHAGVPGRVAQF